MENTENLVIEEQITENVEQPTEESPKMFTEAEFNAKLDEVLGRRLPEKKPKSARNMTANTDSLRKC